MTGESKSTIPQGLYNEAQEYFLPLKHAPKTVLDIGANIGAFTKLACKAWPDAKIYAYEPFPENVRQFKENCGNGRVTVSQLAVRSFQGKDSIFLGNCHTTGSFRQLGEQKDALMQVDCMDAKLLPEAEFVKIDTEGCEVEILSRMNLGETQVVSLEYHTNEDREQVCQILRNKGFQETYHASHFTGNGVLHFCRPEAMPERPTTQKAFIALPIYGAIDPHFFLCYSRLIQSPPVNMAISPRMGDSLVSRARNVLTMDFLKSDCTHMLFIDSDLIFSNEHIVRILSHNEPIVGGFYPKKKQGEVELVCNFETNTQKDERNLIPMQYLGTGFICIAREVFEKMISVYGEEMEYRCDSTGRLEYDFWKVGNYKFKNGSKRYLSEDWYFCQRALDLGYKVWGDLCISLGHSGNAVYPLDSQQDKLFGRTPDKTGLSDNSAAPSIPVGAAEPI